MTTSTMPIADSDLLFTDNIVQPVADHLQEPCQSVLMFRSACLSPSNLSDHCASHHVCDV